MIVDAGGRGARRDAGYPGRLPCGHDTWIRGDRAPGRVNARAGRGPHQFIFDGLSADAELVVVAQTAGEHVCVGVRSETGGGRERQRGRSATWLGICAGTSQRGTRVCRGWRRDTGSRIERVRAPLTALPMSPKYLAIVLKPATGSDRGTARHARVATKEVSTRRSKKRDRRTDNGTIAMGSFPVTRARGTARRVRGAFSRGNGRRMRTCCVETVRSLTRAQTKCARRSSPTIADTAGDCQRTAGRVTRTK